MSESGMPPTSPAPEDLTRSLEARLRAELEALVSGKRADGEVCRLKDAVDASRALVQPPARHWRSTRLIPPALLVLTAMVALVLLRRVDQAEAEIDLVLSAIEIKVLQESDLIGAHGEVLPVRRFNAQGWRWIHAPVPIASNGDFASVIPLPDDNPLVAPGSVLPLPRGAVNIDYLRVPKQARLLVEYSDVSSMIRLRMHAEDKAKDEKFRAKLTAVSPYELSVGGNLIDADSGAIEFIGDTLDIEFQATAPRSLIADQIPVAEVNLDEKIDLAHVATRFEFLSRIRSGTITFLDTEAKVELRIGDLLRVELRDGLVRYMTAQADGIHLALRVSAARLDLGPSRRDLRPSHLGIINAAQGPKVFVGAVLWLFGLMYATWRWWQKEEK